MKHSSTIETTPTAPDAVELWTIQEAAAFLRKPVGTLYQWRHRKIGPPAGKVGRSLRYDPADVRAWFRDQVV